MNYNQNFDRQYRCTIGNSGGAFEIGGGQYPLHIAFDIKKADTKSNNSATVTIWNLNDNHVSALDEPDCRLLLKAGYGTRLSQIFEGTVSYASTEMDGGDRKTEIELVDGYIATRDTYISVSYNEKISWKSIIDDVANKMGMAVSYSYNASENITDISSGFSFVGKGIDVLSKACNSCGLSWSIQNGVIQIKKPNDVMNTQVYVLSSDTGLIGWPKKVSMEKSKTKGAVKNLGYDVNFLLNGAIEVNNYVKVESKAITGFYKVFSISHKGDNVSGDWISTARLTELSSSGSSSLGSSKDTTSGKYHFQGAAYGSERAKKTKLNQVK